jgi:hypothetical protein
VAASLRTRLRQGGIVSLVFAMALVPHPGTPGLGKRTGLLSAAREARDWIALLEGSIAGQGSFAASANMTPFEHCRPKRCKGVRASRSPVLSPDNADSGSFSPFVS